MIPNIRFPGYMKEYSQVALNKIFDRIKRKNANNQSDIPLTIASIEGLVDQRTYFGKTIASKDMSGYYLLKKGEFAYNKSYSKGFPVGSIKRLDKYDQGALSTLYICFVLKDNEHDYDSDYLVQYFNSNYWNHSVSEVCAEGARNHGLLNVSPDDFFSTMHNLPPSIQEQQKIADFLSSYDEKISIQRERVEAFERRKKGLLQKVFSQEIRFKADDGSKFPEWEKKSIDSLFHVSAGGDIDKDHFSVLKGGDYIYPIYANALTNDGLYGYSSKYTVEDKAITVTGRGEIGHATAREGKFTPIVRLLVCKPKNFENTKYFEEAINNSKIIIESTGVPQLTVPQLKKIILPVPSQHEQQKIANFFTVIDDQINVERERLATMETIKKGLLQGLFC